MTRRDYKFSTRSGEFRHLKGPTYRSAEIKIYPRIAVVVEMALAMGKNRILQLLLACEDIDQSAANPSACLLPSMDDDMYHDMT